MYTIKQIIIQHKETKKIVDTIDVTGNKKPAIKKEIDRLYKAFDSDSFIIFTEETKYKR